jgi:hypothetical protein
MVKTSEVQLLQALMGFQLLLSGVGSDSGAAATGPAAMSGTNANVPVAVTSVEGGSAELPCDIAAKENDSVYLVLWYRQDSGTPIYRYGS